MTTLSLNLSVEKAAKEMLEALTCKGMMIVYFWSLIIFTVITGIVRENILVLYGYLFGVVSLLGFISWFQWVIPFGEFLKEWLFEGGERIDSYSKIFEKGKYKKSRSISYSLEENKITKSELLYFIIFLGIIPFIFSCLISASSTPFISTFDGNYAIVNDSIVLPIDSSFAITSPFAKVKRVSSDQAIFIKSLQAETMDGVMISADIKVNLALGLRRSEILLFGEREKEISEKLEERLQIAFNRVIGGYIIKTMPNDLLMLSYLVHQESLDLLRGIPLVWSGEFEVTHPKIFYKK